MHAAVTVHMAAPPEAVWNVISDVRNTPRFSPEVFESEWLGGATGPELGAKFRGHVKRNEMGPIYWTTCRVTACEPGRTFGFEVLAGDRAVNNWLYELAPAGDGHPVLVLPGLAASDVSTQGLRAFLSDRGYAAHGWQLGRNAGPRPGVEAALQRRLAELLAATTQALERYDWEGVARPQLLAGTIGSDARALGGAWLPLYASFAPDRELFIKAAEA